MILTNDMAIYIADKQHPCRRTAKRSPSPKREKENKKTIKIVCKLQK